jgi:hypothetical protein
VEEFAEYWLRLMSDANLGESDLEMNADTPASCRSDVNGDGIPETILHREEYGGNNKWITLDIQRDGQSAFKTLDLCYGSDGYKIVDFDSRFPGREILLVHPTSGSHKIPRDSHSLQEEDRSIYYQVKVYAWDGKQARYVPLWSVETAQPHKLWGQFGPDYAGVINDVKAERTALENAAVSATRFVAAAKLSDWSAVKSLLAKDSSAVPLSEVQKHQGEIKRFPPVSRWEIYRSPYDARDVICTISPGKDEFNIVVTPGGINKFFQGDAD